MIPTHATKNGVRYRYYVSQPYLRGLAKLPNGAIIRVPAADIETIVAKKVADHLGNRTRSTIGQEAPGQNIVSANVSRVEVRKSQLAVWLKEGREIEAMKLDALRTVRSRERSLASDSLEQTAGKEVAPDTAATFCRTAGHASN